MTEKNGKHGTKLFKLLFLIVGIRIKNFNFKVLFPYIITMSFIWSITYMLAVLNFIYNHHNYKMDDLVDMMIDIFLGLTIITFVAVNVSQRHNYHLVYQIMEEGLFTYETPILDDTETIKNNYLRKSTRFVTCGVTSLAIGSVAKFVTPLFFGIVEIMHTNGDVKDLPLPFLYWVPFSIHTFPKYLFAYSIGLVTATCNMLIAINLFSIGLLSIMKVLCEIEILSLSVRRMEERAVTMAEQTPSRAADMQYVYWCFKILAKQAVRHHQQILMYIEHLNQLYGMFFLAIVNSGIGLITMCSYRISVETSLTTSSFSNFGLMFAPLLIIGLYCWMGQLVINSGEELRNALNSISWQNLPLSFSKDLLIMGEMLNRPLCLKVAGIYVLGLETFTTVLQATYSYFSVLRSLRYPDST